MTHRMREVLQTAVRQELRKVGKDWPAHSSTLAALVRQGLLSRSERVSRQGTRMVVWTASDAGKVALRAPERVPVERPRYPSRWSRGSGDYTVNPGRSSDWDPSMGALEAPDKVSLVWQRRSEANKIAAQDRKARARQAAEKARYAA